MPGRKFDAGSGYRYGFNGKENDKEINEGALDFGARIYDGRTGRWLSRDIISKAFISSYNYSSNNPINYIDPDGEDNIHFYYAVVRQYAGGKLISAKTTKFSVVEKNNQPNVFIHHKVELRYDGIGGNPVVTRQIDTRFYPDVPGESTGLTRSYWGLVKDNDRKTLIKFIDEYDLSKQDVDVGNFAEVRQSGSSKSDRMKKSDWWADVFKEKKFKEDQEKKEMAGAGLGMTVLSIIAPELLIARFGVAAKGISVIGPRATYREYAKAIGANFLNVTDDAWTMRKNVEFLQGVVKRGDDVIFAGKYNPKSINPNSVLAQEIKYLQKHGYSWTDDFSKLIKK